MLQRSIGIQGSQRQDDDNGDNQPLVDIDDQADERINDKDDNAPEHYLVEGEPEYLSLEYRDFGCLSTRRIVDESVKRKLPSWYKEASFEPVIAKPKVNIRDPKDQI
ncbi:unnamed protein product [Clonostachys byssicola]|uniref:Uncharacterized protein n=1 Tax=Clonostachys byssicola TaxID=160290 RepID=A0A9N9U779_9HYPO|nr:unnamed protein product [Clonostachys byssicola]